MNQDVKQCGVCDAPIFVPSIQYSEQAVFVCSSCSDDNLARIESLTPPEIQELFVEFING